MRKTVVGAAALGLGMACGLVGCQTTQGESHVPKKPQVPLDILLEAEFTPPGQAVKPEAKPAPKPVAPKKVEKKVSARPTPAGPRPAVKAKPVPKRVAKLPAEPTPKPAAKPPAKPLPAKPKRLARPKFEVPKRTDASVWQAPMLARPEAWRVESWENPGSIKAQGNEILLVAAGGEKDKTAFSVSVVGDLSSRAKMLVDLRNPQKENVDVAFAFTTREPNYNYIETPIVSIPPGTNKDMVVDLKAKNFKCAQTHWKHTSAAKGLDKVNALVVLVYSKKKAQIGISNIRFTR